MNLQHPVTRVFSGLTLEPGVPDHAYAPHAATFAFRDTAGMRRGYVVAGFSPADATTLEIFHIGARSPELGGRAYMLDAICRRADSQGLRVSLKSPVLRYLHEVEDRSGPVGKPPLTLADRLQEMGFDSRSGFTRPIGAGILRPVGPSTTIHDFCGADEAALLVAAWPGGLKAAADAIGMPRSKLAAYFAERESLDSPLLAALRRVLHLGFTVYADIGVVPQLEGAYALCGDLPRPKLVSLYDELSHGGDLLLAGEVVPSDGPQDSARRFLVLQAHGGEPCVICFARGGQGSAVLDAGSDALINCSGLITVSRKLYERVRSAVDHAYAAPAFAAVAGNQFVADWFGLTDRLEEVYSLSGSMPDADLVDPALEK